MKALMAVAVLAKLNTTPTPNPKARLSKADLQGIEDGFGQASEALIGKAFEGTATMAAVAGALMVGATLAIALWG